MHSDDDKTHTYVPLTAGTMVSHYRIMNKIGAGGMGEVYLAEDTKLHRNVALKFLPLHVCQDPECRARFTREAEAAAQLDHPNIVAVHEVGEYQGRPFFAMQHVEGQSLKDVIAGQTLPLERIIEIGVQVCDGLQAAHEKGVTHRDIKPSNILIDSHGRARIVDFGLASIMGLDHLTRTGSTLGTVGYMSPEQVRSETVDQRSDLFSLGVVLWEMITGHSPFKCDTEAATLHAITGTDLEPLARFRREAPPELQTIIDKALGKKVTTRYQHADELQADLVRLKESLAPTGESRKVSSRKARWLGLLGALVVLAAGVVLLLVRPWSAAPAASSGKIMLAVLPFENLGNTEDEYFADGMTAEIIGKLSCISGLGVISRQSAMSYKKTTKSTRQIGRELGVEYLLEGTVRYNKNSAPAMVRISPELIRVADNVHLWADQMDFPLANIFQAQAQIARDIAAALDVRLVKGEPQWIERIPTHSTEAYNLLLRAYQYGGPTAPVEIWGDTLISLARQALALDSSIAVAWALQACIHARMYHFGFDRSPDRLALAESAARHAVNLDPNSPEAHFALGEFYYCCGRNYDRALQEYKLAFPARGGPWDPTLLISYALRRQGRLSEALDQQKAYFKLNPTNAGVAGEIAVTYQAMREYEKADQFYRKAIELDPLGSSYADAAGNLIMWKGDLAASRVLMERMPRRDELYNMFWLRQFRCERDRAGALAFLDSVKGPAIIDQPVYWPVNLCRAMVYWSTESHTSMMSLLEETRQMLEVRIQKTPNDYPSHAALGLTYAYLGRKDDALRHADRAVDLYPIELDPIDGPYLLVVHIWVQILLGEYDRAIDEIQHCLELPSGGIYLSAPLLRIDPFYDPIRTYPRFQKLLEEYGT